MGKTKPKNWAVGRWLIESMTEWEREFIDEMVRGYFQFDKDSGSFQFACIEGRIDYRLGERDGKCKATTTPRGDRQLEFLVGLGRQQRSG